MAHSEDQSAGDGHGFPSDDIDWPQHRRFSFNDWRAELPALRAAWDYSAKQFELLRKAFNDQQLPEHLACVVVSGSLSRMEAHSESDLDLIVVADDRNCDVDEEALYESVWSTIESGLVGDHFRRPKPRGIFSVCASWRKMTDAANRGLVNEDVSVYGHRMQLLMDAQPLILATTFCDLQRDLLQWYSEYRICQLFGELGPFHWLWQDVQRYWRSIRSRACWLHSDDAKKSAEVNLKLRSSRLAIVAAFLGALNDSQQSGGFEQATSQLLNQLRRTPLERLVSYSEQQGCELLKDYESIWIRCRDLTEANCGITSDDRSTVGQLVDRIVAKYSTQDTHWIF